MRNFFYRSKDLLIDPQKTFTDIEKSNLNESFIPVILQIICPIILFYSYYHLVNFPWLLSSMTDGLPVDQKSSIMKVMTPTIMSASSAIVIFISVPIVLAITALYFFLVGKIANIPHSYSRWFVFVSWASMPVVLVLPIGLLAILGSDGRLLPAALNPLSLGNILGLEADSPWASLANAVSLMLLWTLFLTAVGLHVWTRMTVAKSSFIAALPYLLIFGTWAAIVLLATAV
ncbi:YIP1 family protein [Sphingomonas kyeonggiensis]|uniref:YIP1 family protein n=1 Tax=Sphingomonas kyeonggiensis TaxID=1268553 RepID=UPI0027D80C24|nr:YIP1 family protein [Sphingomonas kyeonggiensis]